MAEKFASEWERRAAVDAYVAQWLTLGAKPSKKAREDVLQALRIIYQRIGLKEPQFIFCEGPWEKGSFPALIHLMLKLGKEICLAYELKQIIGETPEVRAEWINFKQKAFDQIDWNKEAKRSVGLGATLNERIERKILRHLEALLDNEVELALGMGKFEVMQQDFNLRLGPLARLSFATEFDNDEQLALFQSLRFRLPEPFAKEFKKDILIDSDNYPLNPSSLQSTWFDPFDWKWAGQYDFARKHSRVKLTEQARRQLDNLLVLNRAAKFLFFENACFIMLRPIEAHFNDNWQLHNPKNAAIEFIDCTKRFLWNGVEVDEDWILHPENISFTDIMQQNNIELRRIMIEIFGLEDFIRTCGAKKVQEDEVGVLYRKEMHGDEPLVVVRVLNSTPEPDGDYKHYFIRVPPTTKTAREGVAWTFGLEDVDYKPDIET
jgi:hypothetical protein